MHPYRGAREHKGRVVIIHIIIRLLLFCCFAVAC